MSLPSQTARPIARRTFMHRRGRRRRVPKIVVLVATGVVVLLLVWVFWPTGSSEDSGGEDAPLLVTGVGAVAADDDEDGADVHPTPEDRAAVDRAGTPPARAGSTAPPAAGAERRSKPTLSRESTPAAATPKPPAAERSTRRPADRPSSTPRLPATPSASRAQRQVQQGRDLIARNDPVAGRRVLSDALRSGGLTADEAKTVRGELTALNEEILLGPKLVPDDPYAFVYEIQPNQFLSQLPRKLGLQTDWRFIQHINRISSPQRVRSGQRLKVVTGPFHAVVHKRDFRMDVFLGDEEAPVFVRSFKVGLGEYNSTPEVRFRVRPDSKLENPAWQNPRTGERFAPNDPKNPIGEYWLGLVPEDDRLAGIHVGYGIHGTIEPESIGTEASMGCIRLGSEDVKLVWSMLMESVSSVEIVP